LLSAVPRAGFAGEPVAVDLSLSADDGYARHALQLSAQKADQAIAELAPGEIVRSSLQIPTRERGILRLDRLGVASTFPFGLFRAWAWIHLPIAIDVYPTALGELPAPTGEDGRELGQSDPSAGMDEWAGMRPFRDGDSPHRVIWTAYAREQPLLVTEYHSFASEWLLLDLDRIVSLPLEARLQQICRWVLDAEARGARYALKLPGKRVAADSGPAHQQRCLHELAVFGIADSPA
jgi:uncharacterized protein (DUF58 family)